MKKLVAWVCAIAVVLAIGIGGAFAFGLVDAIFVSPKEGLIALIGTALAIIGLLILSFFWESYRERRKRAAGKTRRQQR